MAHDCAACETPIAMGVPLSAACFPFEVLSIGKALARHSERRDRTSRLEMASASSRPERRTEISDYFDAAGEMA
jgi:hypothetical protein